MGGKLVHVARDSLATRKWRLQAREAIGVCLGDLDIHSRMQRCATVAR